MGKRLKRLFILFVLPIFLFSCGEPETAGHVKWLFAVYIAGDNNLSDAATFNIGQMLDVGSTDDVAVVILCDRGSGTTLYKVERGWLEPLKTYGNLDTGSPETFRLFLKDIKSSFTFDKLAVVVWDHGDGWWHAAFDESSEDALKMAEIRDVFLSEKLNPQFLGFDECLAGMAEVFYAFRDISNVTVASEDAEPGSGWNYEGILKKLTTNPDMTGDELGRTAVDSYYEMYANHTEYCSPECTLISVNQTGADALFSYLNELSAISLNFADFSIFKYARVNATAVEPDYFPSYVDLYSYADSLLRLSRDSSLNATLLNLETSISALYFKSTGNSMKGVSIYFPFDTTEENPDYFLDTENPFTSTLWDDFLKIYLREEG